MSYLKKLSDNIDCMPFTGERKIEPTKVICRGKNINDNWFSPTSMLGTSREIYYNNLQKWGLTPEKEYIAIALKGYGDVFDITIKENDKNQEETYMKLFFDIPE
jgi:hypothetical protein